MANKLSVLILTYNEEKNIADCISSALFADEIIVVDSGSDDQTIPIAEGLGAKVFVHPMTEGFGAQRNFALEQTQADWVFFLDADERITPDLADEICQIVNNNEQYAYNVLRINVLFGQVVKHGGHAPDYTLRFYPRTAIKWDGKVHDHPTVSLPVKKLTNHMMHYTYSDWEKYFSKFNQYTTLMAEQMYAKGKRARFSDLIVRPWVGFIKFYLLKSGWREGKLGFCLAVLHAFYTMVKYIKLDYLNERTSK